MERTSHVPKTPQSSQQYHNESFGHSIHIIMSVDLELLQAALACSGKPAALSGKRAGLSGKRAGLSLGSVTLLDSDQAPATLAIKMPIAVPQKHAL